jgi:hypothetical protein
MYAILRHFRADALVKSQCFTISMLINSILENIFEFNYYLLIGVFKCCICMFIHGSGPYTVLPRAFCWGFGLAPQNRHNWKDLEKHIAHPEHRGVFFERTDRKLCEYLQLWTLMSEVWQETSLHLECCKHIPQIQKYQNQEHYLWVSKLCLA